MDQETFYVVPEADHNALVRAAYRHRGYTEDEAAQAARFSAHAARHGIRTHNAIKALHLDELFGSVTGGCTPGAQIDKRKGNSSRFLASQVWDANKKLGQATAYEAIESCMEQADQFGIAQISVDNAFHYLWGGGYVIEAASRGYIAYTNCTAALAEVVPFAGQFPTLGTNPHSWGFPTTDAIGYPIVVDWATSVISMGRVQQLIREGKELPSGAAVDKNGHPTTDASQVAALTTFGAHKGYGLSLINELMAAFIGGSLPTLRSRDIPEGEKRTPAFYFQVVHPDALSGGAFALGRNQAENVKAVIEDILGHGNEGCLLPGQLEAQWAAKVDLAGGLLFSKAEVDGFCEIADECGHPKWAVSHYKTAKI